MLACCRKDNNGCRGYVPNEKKRFFHEVRKNKSYFMIKWTGGEKAEKKMRALSQDKMRNNED